MLRTMPSSGLSEAPRFCGLSARSSEAVASVQGVHSAEASGALRSFRLVLPEGERHFNVLRIESNTWAGYLGKRLSRLLSRLHGDLQVLMAGELHYPEEMLGKVWPSMGVVQQLMLQHQARMAASRGKYEGKGWVHFQAEPSMVLPIRPEWTDFEDYKSTFSSKYRIRTNRVYQLSAGVSAHRLSKEEFMHCRPAFRQMLERLNSKIAFKTGEVSVQFFAEQFDRWGDAFQFMCYRLNDEPVGFITLLDQDETLYALHACTEPEAYRDMHVYQRMMYDAVATAIAGKYKALHLGKTAPEIKSTLGARPVEEWISVYTPCVFRRMVLRLAARFTRLPEWQLRHPFKHTPE
jgi:hypothetical protein